MKKQSQKTRSKKGPKKRNPASATNRAAVNGPSTSPGEKQSAPEKALRTVQKAPKKPADAADSSVVKFAGKAGQFLREAKVELKKVKWPTRKELLASTVVVIALTLLVAFFLGLVDFGLIKIIRNVVG